MPENDIPIQMCIITSTVNSVSGTQIYVSADETNRRQLTIYSNKVSTPSENAMILPVPNPGSVQFHNFKAYKDVFEDLRRSFQSHRYAASLTRSFAGVQEKLPVYSVGSYNASILETLHDFKRLDTEVFEIAYGLERFLERQYSNTGYGFIVCQLKSGTHTYHPFAYSHHQHPNGRLFVPTMHYHLHARGGGMDENVGDWDHEIYSPATTLRTDFETGKTFSHNSVNWSKFPPEYRWARHVELSLWEREGEWKNCDLFATHWTNPTKWSA